VYIFSLSSGPDTSGNHASLTKRIYLTHLSRESTEQLFWQGNDDIGSVLHLPLCTFLTMDPACGYTILINYELLHLSDFLSKQYF
jgi:hypothetical protein